jgi:hypothetical protein
VCPPRIRPTCWRLTIDVLSLSGLDKEAITEAVPGPEQNQRYASSGAGDTNSLPLNENLPQGHHTLRTCLISLNMMILRLFEQSASPVSTTLQALVKTAWFFPLNSRAAPLQCTCVAHSLELAKEHSVKITSSLLVVARPTTLQTEMMCLLFHCTTTFACRCC